MLADPTLPLVQSDGQLSNDAQRVVDLYGLQIALEQFRAASASYPADLASIFPTYAQSDDGVVWTAVPSDPDTRQPYSYTVTTDKQGYSLAANLSSGQQFSLASPSPIVSRQNPILGIQPVLALTYSGVSDRFLANADPQVQVDNSVGLKASEGEVVKSNPSDARVGIRNLHQFWTNVTAQTPTGNVSLEPSPFNGGDIGGLYAALGAIAPEGTAVWDGSFKPGSAQAFITTPSIAGGSYKAGVLNILTFISAGLAKVPTAGSLRAIISAIESAQKSTDLIGAAQALEDRDFGGFVKHFYKMLSDDNQRTLIQSALNQLGVVASHAALKKLTLIITIFELGRMAFDQIYSLVEGSLAGQVTFSLEALPQPPDADVFAYCSRVGTVDQPDVHDQYEESVKAALTTVLGHTPSGVGVPWRCMDGSVWACDFGANLPCGAAGTSREPTQEMRDYCAQEPEGGIPFSITGHGSLYVWECQGGIPIALGQQYQLDSRGFISDYWYRLDPSAVAPPPGCFAIGECGPNGELDCEVTRDCSPAGLATGQWAEVYGTGSCLNVRESPSSSAATKRCIKDGTVVGIKGGPVAADGYQWWNLSAPDAIYDSWAAEAYLSPITTFVSVTNTAPPSDPFRVTGFGPSLNYTAPTVYGITVNFSETPSTSNFIYEIEPDVPLMLSLEGTSLRINCQCWNFGVGSDGELNPEFSTTYRLVIKQGTQSGSSGHQLSADVVIEFVARPAGGI